MKDVTILLMPLEDGYRAVVGGLCLDTTSLIGFGTRLESLLQRRLGSDELGVEYALSRDLKPMLPVCPTCKGSEEIELAGSHAAHWVADEFTQIDFTKRAKGTCPTCKGLGAQIAGFWAQRTSN